MARWHDPEAAVCSCFHCTEGRYRQACAVAEQAEREEAAAFAALRRASELQLRLPMSPLPHVAHCPGRIQRAASAPCQPELI